MTITKMIPRGGIIRFLKLLPIFLLLAACATSSGARKKKVKKAKKAQMVEAQAPLPREQQQGLAEVRNLLVGQSGDQAVATFDLGASPGVREAEVIVTITIDGIKWTADQLSLAGDFGPGVQVGSGKRIVWNAMKNLPPDFDGEVSWDVAAVENYHSGRSDAGQFGGTEEMVFHAKNGEVRFNHRLHAEMRRDCTECHEGAPGSIAGFGKDFAHKTCKGCHARMNAGPTRCGECHKK